MDKGKIKKIMNEFKSETEVAEVIIFYLKKMGWEVYQEVQIRNFGNIADIVATQGNLVWVLECKKSFGLTVIAQAHEWRGLAHYVSIVVPYSRRDNNDKLKRNILKYLGIGCYTVSKVDTFNGSGYLNNIKEFAPIQLHRKVNSHYITQCLTEQHKTWAKAGNANGDRYSPFQHTKRQLIETVKKQPGITIKDLIQSIDHHYSSESSAKGSILQWIHKGVITELELKHEGRGYKVFLRRQKNA